MTYHVTHLDMQDAVVLEEEFATEAEALERYHTTRAIQNAGRYTVNANLAGETYPLLCKRADIEERSETIRVTPMERDAILAALRLFQQEDELDPMILDIAENGRGHGGFLQDDKIDLLCERINCGDAA